MGLWIFALGLVVVPALPAFVPLPLLLFFVCASLLLVRAGFGLARYPLYFTLGLLINTWQVQSLVQSQLAEPFDNTLQSIEFKIVSIPQKNPLSTVFLADVQKIQCVGVDCPDLLDRRIRLSWYKPKQPLLPGQVWSSKTKLKRPRGLANPGGFDYQAWLLTQNIVATGYVHGSAKLLTTEWTWAAVRLSFSDRVSQLADGNRFARFWTTLLIADSAEVTPADWQTLQATGTIHLVAISGAHIALVSLWAFGLGGLCARLCCLFLPRYSGVISHWFPPLLSCLFALVYAGLADFSIPTIRAFVACVAINLCWLMGLRIKPLTLLGFGVAMVALSEPMAWQSNGFWLSFAAVLLLIHVLTGRVAQSRLKAVVGLQLVLSLGLSVPLLWLGLGVSWLSPVANLVAEPVITFVIVPGLFFVLFLSVVSVPSAQGLLALLDQIFAWLWRYLEWLETLPQPLIWSPKPLSAWVLSLAFLGVLLLLAPRGMRVRGLGVLTIALSVLVLPPEKPDLRLTVMDVGQGLSVVIKTKNSTWVYDTGPAYSEFFDAGSRIAAPYLHSQGISELSMIVSHSDIDHSGGTGSLLAQFKTQSLMVGERLNLSGADSVSDSRHPEQQQCEQGQQWPVGDGSMRVLWPPKGSLAKDNRASCVVLLEIPQTGKSTQLLHILFTGDIDRDVERRLLPLLPPDIDVLIAPHHGSKSSSGQDFVGAVKPKYVVFSAGYKNRFNHPHPIVEARYRDVGAKAFNTATSGAIIFEWHGDSESISETRKTESKLWYP